MSSDRRFEQELPGLLDELYVGPMPAYRDHVLQQTARTRQRPAWSFLERWLPMVDIARQPVLAPRLPWRTIGLGFMLLALLVAIVAALVVGGREKLPQPFGPARNGLVAYASGGDIYTVDPVSGNSTAIVGGPELDINPRWSRDGASLAFERKVAGQAGPGLLFVARRDGSDLVQVTPDPLPGIASYTFSPDGKEILIAASPGGVPRILIAAADGRQIRQLDLPAIATDASWRPPNGSEILFLDTNGRSGIYAVSADGGKVRAILARVTAPFNLGRPMWSPDGSLISYGEWVDSADANTVQIHVITADGTRDRILPIPSNGAWQEPFTWSNDGTRVFAVRGYTGGEEATRLVSIPVDGSGPGIEITYSGPIEGAAGSFWEWAPDDSLILGTPSNASGAFLNQVLLDPVAGTSRTLPWTSVSQPSWQRLAP